MIVHDAGRAPWLDPLGGNPLGTPAGGALARCLGFRVDSAYNGRIGFVRDVRLDRSSRPYALGVTTGLFHKRLMIVPVSEIGSVRGDSRVVLLRASPRLLGTEDLAA